MRQKLRNRRPAASIQDDPSPIDLSDTARRLALFETGIGWQHGVIEILVALLAAVMFVPLRPFPPSGLRFRDSRSGTPDTAIPSPADRG